MTVLVVILVLVVIAAVVAARRSSVAAHPLDEMVDRVAARHDLAPTPRCDCCSLVRWAGCSAIDRRVP